jgi:hypothetical protein
MIAWTLFIVCAKIQICTATIISDTKIQYSRKENIFMNNKFPYLLAGGVAGGILGYLIADYLAYKIDEAEFETTFEEDEEELVGGMDKELYDFRDDGTIGTDYAKRVTTEEKETLEVLTRPYQDEKAPYIISAEEWGDTISAFDHKTILFYDMDCIYCDDQEVPIDDPENMFVPNAHLHFGENSDDPDVVYISNPGRSEMYEILRMRANYKIDVLGEIPADSPKEDSPKKRDSQPGSPKERVKRAVEELGDVDTEFDDDE